MARIAIIGTGRMASGLASGWARAGHAVVFGSRSPTTKGDLLARISNATVAMPEAALTSAEVVVLAMPFPVVEPFARANAAQLRGKVVIDISSPFSHLPDNRVAGAELTAAAIDTDAHVIAAFKANFAGTLGEPVDANGIQRDVHFAGDSDQAKTLVTRLIVDLGFKPVDCGSLHNARILDGMVPLILELDRLYAGGEMRSSWKLLT
ncbi:MAG TPA: NAD(P)-binding domain-containing protein [Chloroflexota bacterium]